MLYSLQKRRDTNQKQALSGHGLHDTERGIVAWESGWGHGFLHVRVRQYRTSLCTLLVMHLRHSELRTIWRIHQLIKQECRAQQSLVISVLFSW